MKNSSGTSKDGLDRDSAILSAFYNSSLETLPSFQPSLKLMGYKLAETKFTSKEKKTFHCWIVEL
jgi:hypothetical protein